jgi:CubicO group peptidase (beta-lactamase class C family)
MVAKLVEQGRLRFEDTLGQLLPDVPSDKTSITLHQLLTHTAGFPEASGDDDEALTREAFLARALAMELRLKPGARYAYSNVGYGVLAAVAEIVSERSYEQLLRENVLRGPEFPDTGYQSVYEDARSMRSPRGETIREASWGGHDPGWNLIGNGGLVSSLPDMIHFRQALTAGEILSQASLDLLHTKHVAEDRRGRSHYGYGLVVQDVEGLGRVYWHDGGNDVFSAQWAEYVDQGDLIFTAGADSRAGDAFEAMQVLADALYGGT